MFQSLRLPDFRLLWIANIIASFAMQMQMVARGWLIYDITSSPLALTWGGAVVHVAVVRVLAVGRRDRGSRAQEADHDRRATGQRGGNGPRLP